MSTKTKSKKMKLGVTNTKIIITPNNIRHLSKTTKFDPNLARVVNGVKNDKVWKDDFIEDKDDTKTGTIQDLENKLDILFDKKRKIDAMINSLVDMKKAHMSNELKSRFI